MQKQSSVQNDTQSASRSVEKTHTIHEVKQVKETTCCIVGGGPAGAMLALLLARKGVRVTLLEAHMDFEREFRGDTIHPAVMENLDQLGLAERLLQLPHTEQHSFSFQGEKGMITVANFDRIKTKFPFVTVIAQSRFLDFIVAEAQRYPNFELLMGAQVDELLEEDGSIRGVRYRGNDGWYELRAALTVAADGRFSRLRKLAGFEPIKTSPPLDILWFRLSRKTSDPNIGLGARINNGTMVVMIDRLDYWQVGYVIPKGGYQHLRAQGLLQFQRTFAGAMPEYAERINEIHDWKQLSILVVEASYLKRWHRPGLLLIGDAAHVMSPVGGVGINYAIQDAIATFNILLPTLQFGIVHERDLAKIQRTRMFPTRLIQSFQTILQKRVLFSTLKAGKNIPSIARLLGHTPILQGLAARLIGFGFRPVRLKR